MLAVLTILQLTYDFGSVVNRSKRNLLSHSKLQCLWGPVRRRAVDLSVKTATSRPWHIEFITDNVSNTGAVMFYTMKELIGILCLDRAGGIFGSPLELIMYFYTLARLQIQ